MSRRLPGFSLMELLMIVSFAVIVATLIVTFGMRSISIQELDRARDTTLSELLVSRDYAIGGTGDSAWGVLFSATSITAFKGFSYASRDTAYDRTSPFASSISLSGATSVVFLPPDGSVVSPITVVFLSGVSSATVSVNQIGRISAY